LEVSSETFDNAFFLRNLLDWAEHQTYKNDFDEHLAIKLAASLSEATTSGGFGSGLLLRTSHI
jgi:hypothetical protein